MNQRFGYARVTTEDQHLDLQREALQQAGWSVIYEKAASRKNALRPALEQSRNALRTGDTLIMSRLDRLGRSLPDLVPIVAERERNGVSSESLAKKIEMGSAAGNPVLQLFAMMMAEFERSLICERTHAGLAASRAIGPSGGRKPKLGEETGVGNQGADMRPGNPRGRRGEALWGIANYALQTCRRYRPEEPMSAAGLPAHVRNSRHPARGTISTFEETCLSAAEKCAS